MPFCAGDRRHLTHATGPGRWLGEGFTTLAAGFDELVVCRPDGERGSRMWSDPHVHADGVAAVRGARPLG